MTDLKYYPILNACTVLDIPSSVSVCIVRFCPGSYNVPVETKCRIALRENH